MKYLKGIVVAVALLMTFSLSAQDRYVQLKKELETLALTSPGLNNPVQSNYSKVSLKEFVRAVATANKLNVMMDPSIEIQVANTFSNVNIVDLFVYLCKQYQMDIEFTGSIMTFVPYRAKEVPKPRKIPDIKYNESENTISFNLVDDSLEVVAHRITELTGQNILIGDYQLSGLPVNIFIQNKKLKNALDKLALVNNLELEVTRDGFYMLNSRQRNDEGYGSGRQEFEVLAFDSLVTVHANTVPLSQIIEVVSQETGKSYIFAEMPEGNATVALEKVTYDNFLNQLLTGSKYTYAFQDGVYVIGSKNSESLKSSKVIRLKNRRIDSVIESIPKSIIVGLEITEFKELNAFIVAGNQERIAQFERFLNEIDVVVPMITIEVIITDVLNMHKVTAGLSASLGLGGAPATTTGTISPGVDLDLSTTSINDIIGGINGLGIVNLGNISPDFGLRLEALEENGDLKVHSTPSQSTLNGHSAQFKIGRKVYYQLVINNFNNGLISNNQQSINYESVEANLEIKIRPVVSQNKQVTLDIAVEDSDFENLDPEGVTPPNVRTRSFTSKLRVKHGEMALLGGLETDRNDNSGSGLPLISRVPVLKWIFGRRVKEKTKTKLAIFIRPIVTYN